MLLSFGCVALGLGLVEGLTVGTLAARGKSWQRDDTPLALPTTAAALKLCGQTACSKLVEKYPADTFLPSSSNYTLESNTGTWRQLGISDELTEEYAIDSVSSLT